MIQIYFLQDITHPRLLLVHGELLLLDVLELGAQVELARLLLQLGELVLVLGHLLQGGLDAARIKQYVSDRMVQVSKFTIKLGEFCVHLHNVFATNAQGKTTLR